MSDCSEVQLIAHFPEICRSIHEALQGPAKVLVHCCAGRSRSAAAVLAYLMWSQHMTVDEAHIFLRSKRVIVCPNPGFLKQLSLWQKLDCELAEPPIDRYQTAKILDEKLAALNALAIEVGKKPLDMPEGDDNWHTDAFWKRKAPVIVEKLYILTVCQQGWQLDAMSRMPQLHALSGVTRPAKPIKAGGEKEGIAKEKKGDA